MKYLRKLTATALLLGITGTLFTIAAAQTAPESSAAQLKAWDTDHDGTLDKSEYLALVEIRFKAADTDHDGTISGAELGTKAGQALVHLLK